MTRLPAPNNSLGSPSEFFQPPAALPASLQVRALAATAAESQYSLVLLDDDGALKVEPFATLQELLDRMSPLAATDVFMLPFLGYRLQVSKQPRHLMTPFGNFPLCVAPVVLEPEPDGFMGVRAPQPRPPESPEAADATGDDGTQFPSDEIDLTGDSSGPRIHSGP